MIRLAGSLLILGAFGWLGFSSGWELRRRTALLSELLGAIERFGRELERSLKPLPALLDELSRQTTKNLAFFFSACAQHSREPEPSFSAGWQKELEQLSPKLGERAAVCMAGLGRGLGRYDEEGEHQLLTATVLELRECVAESREQCRQRCRLYGTLGMTAGAMCVIFLL